MSDRIIEALHLVAWVARMDDLHKPRYSLNVAVCDDDVLLRQVCHWLTYLTKTSAYVLNFLSVFLYIRKAVFELVWISHFLLSGRVGPT